GGVHPPGPEGVQGPGPRGELAAGSGRGDPSSLAEETEEGRLQDAEVDVRTDQGHHGLLRIEDRALVDRLDLDATAALRAAPLEEPQRLLEAGKHGPSPVGRERTGPDLGDDERVLVLRLQDFLPAQEVDVGDLARADVVGRRHVPASHAFSSSTSQANSAAMAAADPGPPDSARIRTTCSGG